MSDFLLELSRQFDDPGDGAGDRAAWEPVSFRVGDRVQIRLSAECRENWGHEDLAEAHPSWADGRTGTIEWHGLGNPTLTDMDNAASILRHPYLVRLDVDGPGGVWGLNLAGAELLPLDPAATGDGQGAGEEA